MAAVLVTLTVLASSLAWLVPRPTRADLVDDHIVAQAPQVDAYFQSQMTRQHIPGLSVAVVHDGKLLLARSYGLANVELSVPASPSSVYQLESITKQFTAVAIMMLVEEGKVSLDAKITGYLSNLPAAWSNVTVRQLLTHTSGIPDIIGDEYATFIKTAREDVTTGQALSLVRDKPLKFQPGEKWSYSNTGYILLGMIIEQVSGSSYATFLSERIFKPLQMTATRVNNSAAIIPNRATGYTFNSSVNNAELWSPTWYIAAGAIVSSVEDLAKWDAALDTEVLLKSSSLELMWTPALLNNGKPAVGTIQTPPFTGNNYGFGWNIVNYGKKNSIVFHDGSGPGFSTGMCRYLDDKVTVIVLQNSDAPDALALANGLHQVVASDLPASTP